MEEDELGLLGVGLVVEGEAEEEQLLYGGVLVVELCQ